MTNWIDFKRLNEQLDFADVLRSYGVKLELTGDQHHGFCPLPVHIGKRKSASFSANVKKGIWHCFGACGQSGNILDFAVLMERGNLENGADVRRVASQLQKRFLNGSKPAEKTPETDDANAVINAPLDFELKGLDATHPYLLDRGFDPETIEEFGLGYCSRGLLSHRIAIPLHNNQGKLVGYAGRVIDDNSINEDNPKYKFPGRRNRKGVIHEFRKSLLLYNAHSFIVGFPFMDLVVVEGFSAVWWLRQAYIYSVVATMGASCSEAQAKAIVSLVKERGRVWIFTDGDAAGERCAEDIFRRVAPHRCVRWVQMEAGKQPTGFSPSELKNLFPFEFK
jgi:DNA primase